MSRWSCIPTTWKGIAIVWFRTSEDVLTESTAAYDVQRFWVLVHHADSMMVAAASVVRMKFWKSIFVLTESYRVYELFCGS
jgi:hypothetical protein